MAKDFEFDNKHGNPLLSLVALVDLSGVWHRVMRDDSINIVVISGI